MKKTKHGRLHHGATGDEDGKTRKERGPQETNAGGGSGDVGVDNGGTSTSTSPRLARYQSERAVLPIWLARKQLLAEVRERERARKRGNSLVFLLERREKSLFLLISFSTQNRNQNQPAPSPRHRHPRRRDGIGEVDAAPPADARRRARQCRRTRRRK